MKMKIAVFMSADNFSKDHLKKLHSIGNVVFLSGPLEKPHEELLKFAKDADIIAIDPDNFGGFETARERVTQLLEELPNLKGIALDTTSYGWIDLKYCKKRKLPVCNVPNYSRESLAEHTIALLLGVAKKIFISDRKTQKGTYTLEKGFELKGKTLGVIGLGSIGSRTGELGRAIGMRVIAYNRSPKSYPGIEIKSFDDVLKESDAIALHATHSDENKGLIGKKELKKMKIGVIVVNTADRELVDEHAMTAAIKSGKVFGYAYEAEDLEHTPLALLENALGFKGFSWNTKEAVENLNEIWIKNIKGIAENKIVNNVIPT